MDDNQQNQLWSMYANLQQRLDSVNTQIKDAGVYGNYAGLPSLLQQQAGLVGSMNGMQLALNALGYHFIEDKLTHAIALRKIPDIMCRCSECAYFHSYPTSIDKRPEGGCDYFHKVVYDSDPRCYYFTTEKKKEEE